MVKTPLVIPNESFGAEILKVLDNAGFPTTVALWLKEDDSWELVFGTPLYDQLGQKKAYLKLISALSSDGPVALSDYPIRLESTSSPLIKNLRKLFHKTASVEGMRLGGHKIGGQWIDDGYVYGSSNPAAR